MLRCADCIVSRPSPRPFQKPARGERHPFGPLLGGMPSRFAKNHPPPPSIRNKPLQGGARSDAQEGAWGTSLGEPPLGRPLARLCSPRLSTEPAGASLEIPAVGDGRPLCDGLAGVQAWMLRKDPGSLSGRSTPSDDQRVRFPPPRLTTEPAGASLEIPAPVHRAGLHPIASGTTAGEVRDS